MRAFVDGRWQDMSESRHLFHQVEEKQPETTLTPPQPLARVRLRVRRPTDTTDTIGVLPSLRFWVSGLPRPQGSKRAFVTASGKATLVESCKQLPAWRQDVATMARRAVEREAWTYPAEVSLRVLFLFSRPKSHLTSKGVLRKGAPQRPRSRNDIEKLCRSICDAMTGIAFEDDGNVVSLSAHKRYTFGEPGAVVIVEPADEHDLDADLTGPGTPCPSPVER